MTSLLWKPGLSSDALIHARNAKLIWYLVMQFSRSFSKSMSTVFSRLLQLRRHQDAALISPSRILSASFPQVKLRAWLAVSLHQNISSLRVLIGFRCRKVQEQWWGVQQEVRGQTTIGIIHLKSWGNCIRPYYVPQAQARNQGQDWVRSQRCHGSTRDWRLYLWWFEEERACVEESCYEGNVDSLNDILTRQHIRRKGVLMHDFMTWIGPSGFLLFFIHRVP